MSARYAPASRLARHPRATDSPHTCSMPHQEGHLPPFSMQGGPPPSPLASRVGLARTPCRQPVPFGVPRLYRAPEFILYTVPDTTVESRYVSLVDFLVINDARRIDVIYVVDPGSTRLEGPPSRWKRTTSRTCTLAPESRLAGGRFARAKEGETFHLEARGSTAKPLGSSAKRASRLFRARACDAV